MSTPLTLRCPASFLAERSYTFDVLLRRALGVEVMPVVHDAPTVELSGGGRTLQIHDRFLGGEAQHWGQPDSLPKLPLPTLHSRALCHHPAVPQELPVLYGDSRVVVTPERIELGADLFGGAFFMLSRYEEVVLPARDAHGRFAAESAIATRAGFLELPLVDAYVELLWSCIARLWPERTRPLRRARMRLGCDVDWPFKTDLRWARSAGAQLARQALWPRSPERALRYFRECVSVARRGLTADPYYTFPEYMTRAEQAGLRASFHFIAGHTAGDVDGTYDLNDGALRRLLQEIHQRGHEIALHPSYHSYRSSKVIREELDALKRVCTSLGIAQDSWGARQHFLRWEPATLRRYADAGLSYDATLSFASHAGFRAGTCHPYPAYDLEARCTLPLQVRPLVAMDGTVLTEKYMGLDHARGAAVLNQLMDTCKAFGGEFSLLWHNSMLEQPADRELFVATVQRMGRLDERGSASH